MKRIASLRFLKGFLLAALLLLCQISAYNQYRHRTGFSASLGVFAQEDLVNLEAYDINYMESYQRNGKSVSFGLSYYLDKLPMSLNMSYDFLEADRYTYTSTISSTDDLQSFTMNSLKLHVNWEIMSKAALTPYLLAGFGVTAISYSREGLEYTSALPPDSDVPIIWGFDLVETSFYSPVYTLGAGIRYRIKDNVLIFVQTEYSLVYQDKTSWMGDKISVLDTRLGMSLRLYKRKKVYY